MSEQRLPDDGECDQSRGDDVRQARPPIGDQQVQRGSAHRAAMGVVASGGRGRTSAGGRRGPVIPPGEWTCEEVASLIHAYAFGRRARNLCRW